jgi:hypothetical protein
MRDLTGEGMKPTEDAEPLRAGGRARACAVEADVAVFYRFIEAVARGATPSVVVQHLAQGFVEHGAGPDHDAVSLASGLAARRCRFHDAEWCIERLVGVGGLVICDAVLSWDRHDGGRDQARETLVARVEAGRIAECWRVGDARLRLDAALDRGGPGHLPGDDVTSR